MNGSRWAILAVLLAVTAAGAVPGCGRTASVPAEAVLPASTAAPRRIASLTLATDEILAELVPAERMACVTYLVDDREISNVAGRYPSQIPRLREADIERIISLAPDLVCVAPYNSADFLKTLKRSGLSLYRNEAYNTIDQIQAGIQQLGEKVGSVRLAGELVKQMVQRRERLAVQLRGISRRPQVLYWSAGFTSGKATTIDDIIREAGGVNMAAEQGLQGPVEITPEQVIAANPEFILLSQWSADERESRIENHPLLRKLRAVREGNCLVIEGRYLSSVSQHVVAGIEHLARKLHPDCFEDDPASPSPSTAAR